MELELARDKLKAEVNSKTVQETKHIMTAPITLDI